MPYKKRWIVFLAAALLVPGCAGTRDGEQDEGQGSDGQVASQPSQPATSPATEADGATSTPAGPMDSATTPADDAGVQTQPDQGSGPGPQNPPAVVICRGSGDCGGGETCLKLASDNYAESAAPAQGICFERCTNTTAACSSSADHYHPCISAATHDLGSVSVCAIACLTQFPWEGGVTKQYACPEGTYCSRTIAGMMKICNPYP